LSISMQIGFIGAGQMARALARGFVEQQRVEAHQIMAADPLVSSLDAFAQLVPAAATTSDNRAVLADCELIFLAVKPQQLPAIYAELRPVPTNRLIVSISAGVTIEQLGAGLGTQRIVRIMPNTPCLVGQGASGLCRGVGASEADGARVEHLMQAVGRCWQLPETLLDAVTGLSGSGPAFVYQFIEALSDGGVLMGLPRHVATQLAAQTVLGSAQMVLQTGEHPSELKDRVASPGGTTIAGLVALESGGLRGTVISAVRAATERSRQLGQSTETR
jgi:pyrroline-5-carboxylate reductase